MSFDLDHSSEKNNLWHISRPVFLVFSLYLIGDAFYRWDGFSYYASFSEFLPSVALAFILWSLVAALTSIVLWLSFNILIMLFRLAGLKITIEHLLSCIVVFMILGALIWKGKRIIWPYVQTPQQLKLIIGACLMFMSAALIWLLRSRAGTAVAIIQERITPLVWLFGLFVLCSMPLVAYHAWWKTDKIEALKAAEPFITENDRPNIILLTFDGLAARNMSLYGYRRETTPFISRWAEEATVFTKAEASCNFTTPAVASLMTGKRVWTHQTYQIEGTKPVHGSLESLPALLKKNGYFNVALVVNPFASVGVLGMSDSFDIAPQAIEFGESASLFGWKFGVVDKILYRAFGDKIRLHNWIIRNDFILSKLINLVSRNIYQTTVPPAKAFNRFIDIIDADIPKPFFAWIHVFPPHDPYLPPVPFQGKFSPSDELRTYKKQEKLVEKSYEYLFQYLPLPAEMQPSVDLMRDYYDEYIAYIDKNFEDFIEGLSRREMKNTMIILSADHGESFEHGYLTHGGPFLYEQVTHIPLMIQGPGWIRGQTVDSLVEQIDIPATILDMAGVPAPMWMEGRSLVPLMNGEEPAGRPAFSMNFEQNPSLGHRIGKGSIAVWQGDYKLIHYLARNESLLFNLRQDPEELEDLIAKETEVGQRLFNILMTGLKQANDNIRRGQ